MLEKSTCPSPAPSTPPESPTTPAPEQPSSGSKPEEDWSFAMACTWLERNGIDSPGILLCARYPADCFTRPYSTAKLRKLANKRIARRWFKRAASWPRQPPPGTKPSSWLAEWWRTQLQSRLREARDLVSDSELCRLMHDGHPVWFRQDGAWRVLAPFDLERGRIVDGDYVTAHHRRVRLYLDPADLEVKPESAPKPDVTVPAPEQSVGSKQRRNGDVKKKLWPLFDKHVVPDKLDMTTRKGRRAAYAQLYGKKAIFGKFTARQLRDQLWGWAEAR